MQASKPSALCVHLNARSYECAIILFVFYFRTIENKSEIVTRMANS